MPQVLFATQSYQSRSLPLSSQRCVNAFMEKQPPDADSQVPVFGIPGMVVFSESGNRGPVRGFETMGGITYAVIGEGFFQISESGTATQLGASIIIGSEVVSMAENGTQIVIVNDEGGYLYSVATGLVKITSTAFYRANTVTFFDNYFVFDRADTNQFFISGILDGLSYNGLDFASAEASAKNVVGITQNLQLLYIFSEDHFEIWYDAGTSDFPFQRYTGGVVWRGCLSPHSIIKQDQKIYFLGDDGVFYRLDGNVPVRVSTHAIERLISEEPDKDKIHCFTHTLEGHKFIHLTLPQTMHTLSYDTTTQLWHERMSTNTQNSDLGRWRANCVTESYGLTLFGDAFDGVISYQDWNVYTERGNTIKLIMHSKPYDDDKKRLFCSRLELDMEAGVGLNDGQGSDPQAMLRISKDGGRSWSLLQPWRSIGKIGEFLTRLRWLRLGVAYRWCFELTITDPVKRVVIGAHADFEEGM